MAKATQSSQTNGKSSRGVKRGNSASLAGQTGPGHSATELVRVAFDEFNLATFPISVLDKKAQASHEPLVFHDKISLNGETVERMWKVFPHPEKGFPGPIDDDVLMALLELTREQGGSKRVYFSRYDLLKRLGWPINATYYTRLETSFKKLAAVRVEAINAFGDRSKKRFVNMGLTVIQEWKLNSETRGGEKSSYVLWSDRIAESIHQELTRYLDATFYFEELSSAIERRLFRYLDNIFDTKQLSAELDVRNLAHEHLGISRQYKYLSQIMQRIEPALKTLIDKGYLQSWVLAGETLHLTKQTDFGSRVQLALPFLVACSPTPQDTDVDMLRLQTLLVERGVVGAVAARLCETDTDEHRARILAAVRYFDSELSTGKRFANPGGFLVSLVRRPLVDSDTRSRGEVRRPRAQAVKKARSQKPQSYELEYAYQTYLDNIGADAFDNLADSDRAVLVETKVSELLGSSNAKTYRNMPKEIFDEHVRYMVRKDLAGVHGDSFDSWMSGNSVAE